MLKKIPLQVREVLQKLEENGFEAFIVGGCVRDLLLALSEVEGVGRSPKDWDVATNAKPEEIQKIFSTFAGATADKPATFYENDFGTVGLKVPRFIEDGPEREYDVIEITTYRIESKYSDKRRPDAVKFAETLEEDLSRRDFQMNAIALKITNHKEQITNKPQTTNHKPQTNFEIVDPYDGQSDIKNKIIQTVGDPAERFDEDALRMMRAVRFHAELNFSIEKNTFKAIKKHAVNMEQIAQERIKDEFVKIILSDNPAEGIDMLHETGLLAHIIPELEKGYGVAQNRHHIYTIYQHCVLALKHCPSKKLEVRLAALLHDIAKPQTKRGEGEFATFYNHDHVGARVAEKILTRLRFSNEVIEKVKLLVDNHMFYYNPEEVGDSSVRRLIAKVGLENMKDLIDVRIADRLGSGTPKAKPYKLRHLEYMIDKLSHDAVSVKMLKINGNDLMKDLKVKPGPIIGAILDVLLAEVIEDAGKNNRETLLACAKELKEMDLEKLRKMAKVKIEERKEEDDLEIKSKHWVK
jgi:tRNA nucleotidyltransferase (CCA-adding enzyme)